MRYRSTLTIEVGVEVTADSHEDAVELVGRVLTLLGQVIDETSMGDYVEPPNVDLLTEAGVWATGGSASGPVAVTEPVQL